MAILRSEAGQFPGFDWIDILRAADDLNRSSLEVACAPI
jgi:hypothetical protein